MRYNKSRIIDISKFSSKRFNFSPVTQLTFGTNNGITYKKKIKYTVIYKTRLIT